MDFYDISRDIMTTSEFDGDTPPKVTVIKSIENGDHYNLSQVTLSTHQATHIDSPKHFDDEG